MFPEDDASKIPASVIAPVPSPAAQSPTIVTTALDRFFDVSALRSSSVVSVVVPPVPVPIAIWVGTPNVGAASKRSAIMFLPAVWTLL